MKRRPYFKKKLQNILLTGIYDEHPEESSEVLAEPMGEVQALCP